MLLAAADRPLSLQEAVPTRLHRSFRQARVVDIRSIRSAAATSRGQTPAPASVSPGASFSALSMRIGKSFPSVAVQLRTVLSHSFRLGERNPAYSKNKKKRKEFHERSLRNLHKQLPKTITHFRHPHRPHQGKHVVTKLRTQGDILEPSLAA